MPFSSVYETQETQDTRTEAAERGGEARQSEMAPLYPIYSLVLRKDVKKYSKTFLLMMGLITAILWIVLPIFWGSNWLLERYFYRLNIDVVDFDSAASGSGLNAILGPIITNGLQRNLEEKTHLGWHFRDASLYPNGLEDVQNRVIDNMVWGAVVINANATSAWREALRIGNSSYDPSGSIVLYVTSARFFQVIREYQVPLMQQVLTPLISTASKNALTSYLSTLNETGSINTTALALAFSAPNAFGQVFAYHLNDLRPIIPGTWAIEGPLEAGLLYGVIFCFQLAMWQNAAYQETGLKKKVHLLSLIVLRLAIPCIAYFFMSLWYTILFSAFQIPLTHWLGGWGWPATWMLNYISFLALGLVIELALTVLTQRFAPFFLILWIILNITSSFLPIREMEDFYEWLKWTPFYHNTQALKTIVYGQRGNPRRTGLNYGVLITTALINICTLSLATIWERHLNNKRQRVEESEKKD